MFRASFYGSVESLASFDSKIDSEFLEDVGKSKNHVSFCDEKKSSGAKLYQSSTKFGGSSKSSCSYPPVRKRLETLMGTNVVSLTDRKFMLKLMLKLKENYVKQQRRRIEERKKQELSRTKILVINRLIPVHEAPEEVRQYPLFKLFTYCDELLEKKRKKKTKRKIRLSKSLYKLLYPDDLNRGKKIEEKEVYARKIFFGNEEKLVPLTSEEIAKFLMEREAKQDIEDGFMLSEEDYDHLHYETQAVKYLRDTKTVDEMYSKAYDIIGILHSHIEKELNQEQTPEKNVDEHEINEIP